MDNLDNNIKTFTEFVNEAKAEFKIGTVIKAKKDIEEDVDTWFADNDDIWWNNKGSFSEVEIINKGGEFVIVKDIDGEFEIWDWPVEKDFTQRLTLPQEWFNTKHFKVLKTIDINKELKDYIK